MGRLDAVRQEVDSILLLLVSDEDRRFGFVHLYGVAHAATELALRRGLDPELAAVAAMLHDLTNYTVGESADHAARSSQLAGRILEGLGMFSSDEIATVTHAIARHSNKAAVDGPMDELLKDADVAHHWLYDPALAPRASHAARRERLKQELSQAA